MIEWSTAPIFDIGNAIIAIVYITIPMFVVFPLTTWLYPKWKGFYALIVAVSLWGGYVLWDWLSFILLTLGTNPIETVMLRSVAVLYVIFVCVGAFPYIAWRNKDNIKAGND